MIRWAAHHIGWFVIRIGVTLASILTIQHVIAQEGYRVETHDLIVCAVCLIIVNRLWLPKEYRLKE
jgi:uncharacterized membrane protein